MHLSDVKECYLFLQKTETGQSNVDTLTSKMTNISLKNYLYESIVMIRGDELLFYVKPS